MKHISHSCFCDCSYFTLSGSSGDVARIEADTDKGYFGQRFVSSAKLSSPIQLDDNIKATNILGHFSLSHNLVKNQCFRR